MSKRECGSCSLCCKVLDVPAVYKPAGKWCKHFAPGDGCSIHQLRPKSCREFSCLWLTEDWLDDSWKPSASKFVMMWEYGNKCLSVLPDPKMPNAWKAEPYYKVFKALAEKHLAENRLVMIVEANRRILVLPDQDVVVGERDDVYAWQVTPNGQGGFHVEFDKVTDGGAGGPMVFEDAAPAPAEPEKLPTISFGA